MSRNVYQARRDRHCRAVHFGYARGIPVPRSMTIRDGRGPRIVREAAALVRMAAADYFAVREADPLAVCCVGPRRPKLPTVTIASRPPTPRRGEPTATPTPASR
ncbi:MAG: hypothetical protein QOD69_3013 [Solirubrobacteraceae bacterium]|nr:hypothetical protein [Solirubrobacteraceae bacterium]